MDIYTYFTYQSIPKDTEFVGKTVIAIDVLRATSTIITALANGAEKIIPFDNIADALNLKAQFPHFISAAERKGLIVPGFDLGNSPTDYTPAVVGKKTIIVTTTNGTNTIVRSKTADQVLIGALLNSKETAAKATEFNQDLVIICSGTGGKISYDDVICAGSIIQNLAPPLYKNNLNDSSLMALRTYQAHSHDLLAGLKMSAHGKKLSDLGYSADVAYCAQENIFTLVPCYHQGIITR